MLQNVRYIIGDKIKKEIDSLPSAKDMIQYHHGLGMSLRNLWSLWGGSRLSKYFNDKEIFHPDNMSGEILEGYWVYRQNKKKSE